MTERPAHDVDCEIVYEMDRIFCACSYRASIVALERDLGNLLAVIHRDGGYYAAKHGNTKASQDAEAIVIGLRMEREEDRAAIRAYRVQHNHEFRDVVDCESGECACHICVEHAAAIQRAQARP
jgi:hypothetical protein